MSGAPRESAASGENRDAMGQALLAAAERYPGLIVLDADVATSSRTSLFRDRYPDRFVQIGIAEANMAGIAAGLATVDNLLPVISTFACFISRRMLDQIFTSIAYPQLNVKVIGAYAGVPTGKAGATHMALEDMAILRAIPGMVVLDPCDGPETTQALMAALAHVGPVYLRVARNRNPVLTSKEEPFVIGPARLLREGSDIALLSTGIRTQTAVDAADQLEQEGLSVRHLHLPTVKPLDEPAVVGAAREIGRLITIENHSVTGGLGSAVAEVTAEQAPCHVQRLGARERFGETGEDDWLFEQLGMTSRHVVAAAHDLLEKRGGEG